MVGTRTLLGVVLAGLTGFAPMALGQEEIARSVPPVRDDRPLDGSRDDRIDGDGRLIPPPQEAEDFSRPVETEPPAFDANAELRLELPSYRWLPRNTGHRDDFLHQVALTHLPTGSLVVRYEGIEGYVVRKVQSRLRDMWRETLREAWKEGMIDETRYARKLDEMREGLKDFREGGRWWERSWLDSLTPERGGAPAEAFVHTVGDRLEVLSLGPLTFTNDLKASIDKVTVLTFDPDGGQIYRDYDLRSLAREHARLQRKDDDANGDGVEDEEFGLPDLSGGAPDVQGLAEPVARITLEPPDPGVLPGYWRLRFRPSVGVRLDSADVASMLEDVSMSTTLELFLGAKRVKFMELEAIATYDFERQNAILGLKVALVTW